MLLLCEPGGGKGPAFEIGCSEPIQCHVEENRGTKIILDDFTDAGMFQQLKRSQGHKALIGKEEAATFLRNMFVSDKRGNNVSYLIIISIQITLKHEIKAT